MENEEPQGGSAAGTETPANDWPFGIDPSQVTAQETVTEEEPPVTEEEEVPASDELPAEALQIWQALQNPETKDEALKLIHAVTGYEPPQAETKTNPGVKPEEWSDGDWQYWQMLQPMMNQAFDAYLVGLGLDKQTVQNLKGLTAEAEQARQATQAEQKALKMFSLVKAEIKKADKAFPDFTQEQYRQAIKTYPGYKYRDAVRLYLTDTASKPRTAGMEGRPNLAPVSDRRADNPPEGLADVISRGIRQRMGR